MLLNFLLAEPFHTFRTDESGDVVAVLVFAMVIVMISRVIDLTARGAKASARWAAELEWSTVKD